ncbi:pyridoxamine 5'-phosphate oxidase family protein [Streptomyces sp. I05A-00742]|uniref:pyridoxamine 5'-phosphate oxidase family protein n=1 Tax=Streptomyces sp. I05A-00742 TaxID=2732853 RepID=UPI0014888E7E|nr:pyridoxamine 5'-phosphate oxidase family protein [Streptomyces sp. I05A-00742]
MTGRAPMVAWGDFRAAEPGFAASVRAAFTADRHAVLATLRRDGAPRISGIEPVFHTSDIWLFVMPGSVKSADLRHDPRCALHSATTERRCGRHHPGGAIGPMPDDAKISGQAVPVTDPAAAAEFLDLLEARTGLPADCGPELMRVDIEEVSTVRAIGEGAVVSSWRVGGPLRVRQRS